MTASEAEGSVHVVAQGDTMISIALAHEYQDWETIWNHAQNAELRANRNPQVLHEGDEVFVPTKVPKKFRCMTGQVHTFRLKTMPTFFSLNVRDESGEPYADCRYILKVENETFEGRTNGDGLVNHEVKPTDLQGELKVWIREDPEEIMIWDVEIGHLDPVTEITGVQARLNNLGYPAGEVTGEMNAQTKEALEAFQSHIGYDPPTGELDEKTQQALIDAQNAH